MERGSWRQYGTSSKQIIELTYTGDAELSAKLESESDVEDESVMPQEVTDYLADSKFSVSLPAVIINHLMIRRLKIFQVQKTLS